MEKASILARTPNGQLWQAMHYNASPKWTWVRAPESANDIMGHLVLTVASALPSGPGEVTLAMLPGAAGEGASHP